MTAAPDILKTAAGALLRLSACTEHLFGSLAGVAALVTHRSFDGFAAIDGAADERDREGDDLVVQVAVAERLADWLEHELRVAAVASDVRSRWRAMAEGELLVVVMHAGATLTVASFAPSRRPASAVAPNATGGSA